MSNPKYTDYMLPILKYLQDKKIVKMDELSVFLVKELNLTEEDLKEFLPSGKQHVYKNRIGWAKTYLKKAGIVESTERGNVYITERGLAALNTNPKKIDHSFLMKYSEYKEFKKLTTIDETSANEIEVEKGTPEEELQKSYEMMRKTLAQELLDIVMGKAPDFFEKLVVNLLVKMGYGGSIEEAGRAIGKTGDEGIDGIIKEDKLGLDEIYIQAKRWNPSNVIGRPEIQKFVGALAGQGSKKGIFITTSSFTKNAKEYIPKNDTKVALVDGNLLTKLMIDYDIGVSTITKYEIKEVDIDYFEDNK
jgi:restriction system protein